MPAKRPMAGLGVVTGSDGTSPRCASVDPGSQGRNLVRSQGRCGWHPLQTVATLQAMH